MYIILEGLFKPRHSGLGYKYQPFPINLKQTIHTMQIIYFRLLDSFKDSTLNQKLYKLLYVLIRSQDLF